MNIVGIPTLNSFDTLHACIESLNAGSLVPDRIYIMDNSGGKFRSDVSNVHVVDLEVNRGVSYAWNFLLSTFPTDIIVICNDDVSFEHHTFETFISERLRRNDDTFLYARCNTGDNAWSCFSHPYTLIESVGYYDERFFPAYYEDNDMHRRIRLSGREIACIDAAYNHVGSSTLKHYTPEELERHHAYFRSNTAYYIEKWGGLPGHEVFTHPFNGEAEGIY